MGYHKNDFFQNMAGFLTIFSEKKLVCNYVSIYWSNFFFYSVEGAESYTTKKMFIEIELLDHELITKNAFFIFPEFE
jgi:hypothetical protein